MKINETNIDSVIRIFAGFFLLYLALDGNLPGAVAVAANILGITLVLTGVVGFCPLYALFKFKKLKK